jgi:hypothetical protein
MNHPSTTPVIEAHGVVKSYGDVCALDHVDLVAEIEPIGLLLARTAKRVSRAFDDALGDAGGSLPQWLILVSLKGRVHGAQRALAEAIGVEGPTLTHHLKQDGDRRLGYTSPGSRQSPGPPGRAHQLGSTRSSRCSRRFPPLTPACAAASPTARWSNFVGFSTGSPTMSRVPTTATETSSDERGHVAGGAWIGPGWAWPAAHGWRQTWARERPRNVLPAVTA